MSAPAAAARFARLVGCRLPLQLAGMGSVCGPELVAAVCEAGGLGTLAQPMLPPPALAAALDAVRARTARPFGVNFLMPFLDPACVPLAAERARVVEFFWGAPDEKLVARVHAAGALALWQVGDADEARAAADAGCDLVVAQGVEAGGHVRGTRPLADLLPRVLDAVSLPVIAAGGIATAARVAELLRAGAAAVRVGTPFLAAREADAHPDWVRAVIAAKAEDTVVTTDFGNGWPDASHRVLRASLEHARALTDEFVGEVALAGARIPVPRLSPIPPTREASGHVAAMCQYAGTSVDHVTRVCSAAEIVSELMVGAARASGGGG